MTDIRTRMVSLARSFDGVTVLTNRARYLGLVASGESAAMADYMAKRTTSGCALTVRGLFKLLGLAHPRLAPPYKFGLAVADVWAIGRQYGALVTDMTARPLPGDVVLVGGDRVKDGGVEHVFVVTSCNGEALTSIDGGQVLNGAQAILSKVRTWSASNDGSVWDRSRLGTDPGSGAKRRVQGWVSIDRVPFPASLGVGHDIEPPTPRNHGGAELPRRPTLRNGDKGPAVAELQRRLLVDVTGTFDDATDAALRAYQKDHGLKVDGVAGPATWAALLR